MEPTSISPDQTLLWEWRVVQLNATIVCTWIVMAGLTTGSWLITRNLTSLAPIPRWQNLLEIVVGALRREINALTTKTPQRYLPFISTLFLFIAVSNTLDLLPWFTSPAASLSTTTALAICVFLAVPLFGIADQGIAGYLRHYIRPTVFMAPFNVIGEVSRTLALAVRLFGNVMSTAKIAGILLAVAPLFFPVILNALGLLTGLIQAYIFAVLAMVYIASASRASDSARDEERAEQQEERIQARKGEQNG